LTANALCADVGGVVVPGVYRPLGHCVGTVGPGTNGPGRVCPEGQLRLKVGPAHGKTPPFSPPSSCLYPGATARWAGRMIPLVCIRGQAKILGTGRCGPYGLFQVGRLSRIVGQRERHIYGRRLGRPAELTAIGSGHGRSGYLITEAADTICPGRERHEKLRRP
jgi:hypothetical protein